MRGEATRGRKGMHLLSGLTMKGKYVALKRTKQRKTGRVATHQSAIMLTGCLRNRQVERTTSS